MIKRQSFKKCWAALIIVCMLASFIPMMSHVKPTEAAPSTLGESFGFDNNVPEDFDPKDGKNPYGVRATNGNWVNFNPVHELGIYLGEGPDTALTVDARQHWNTLFGTQDGAVAGGGNALNERGLMGTKVASKKDHFGKRHVSAVAFDPTGCGHDNYAAYWGFDAANGWKPNMQVAGPEGQNKDFNFDGWYDWMKDTSYTQGLGVSAITAGDFDGDGKDTVVSYVPNDQSLTLREVSVLDGKIRNVYDQNGNDFGAMQVFKGRFGHLLNTIHGFGNGSWPRSNNTPRVHLTAGNVDEDEADELIATVSIGNLSNEGSVMMGRSSVVVVFDRTDNVNDQRAIWNIKYSQQMEFVYVSGWHNGDEYNQGTGTWFMRRAASSIGDVDGDGKPEIVTVGTATGDWSRNSDETTSVEVATIIDCDGDGLAVRTCKGNGVEPSNYNEYQGHIIQGWKLESAYPNYSGDWYQNVGDGADAGQGIVSLACAQLEGRDTQDYVVAEGLVYRFDEENTSNFRQAWYGKNVSDTQYISPGGLFSNMPTLMGQPAVGNFDGNPEGREQVLFVHAKNTGIASAYNDRKYHLSGYAYVPEAKADTGNDETYVVEENPDRVLGVNKNGNITTSALRICDYQLASDTWDYSMAAVAAVDANTNDGLMGQLKSKNYEFSDVEVMAVLEAAPAFGDLSDEYGETGGTTNFGISTGTSHETKQLMSTRVGTYINVEQEFEVAGVKVAGFEMGTAYENEMTTEMEQENTWDVGIEYETDNQNHQVVLTQTPVIEYLYDVVNPETGAKSVMHVNRPQTPAYSTMTIDKYNDLAATVGKTDEMIGSEVLSSVPGEPTSYRTSLPQAEGIARFGKPTSISQGATVTQTLSDTNMQAVTTEMTHSVDTNGGGMAAGITVGMSGGITKGSAYSVTETKTVSRGGTVAGVENPDYGFSWEFISWNTTLGTGDKAYEVPVLGYLVSNVKQPPSLPKSLDAMPQIQKDGTININLSWDSGYQPAAQYRLYRYMPDESTQYYEIGTVSGGEDHFVYEDVDEKSQYQFCIQAVGADGSMSTISEPVSVFTPSTNGTTPVIGQQPQDVEAVMGQDVTFSIIAAPPVGVSGNLNYQWQSRAEGSNTWRDVASPNSATLTLQDVTASMDGNQYRCEISLLDTGSRPIYAYTENATLTVRAANSSKTDLSLSPTSGKAGINGSYEVNGTTNVSLVFECTDGDKTTTYQRYQNSDGNGDALYYCVQDQTYYTIPEWDSKGADDAENGVIKVSAPTDKTALRDLTGSLMDGDTILTTTDKLRGETNVTETIITSANPEGGEATEENVTYNVVTATAVAVEGTDLKDSDMTVKTLRFYEKDGKYYTDRDGDGKIEASETMKALDEEKYPEKLTVKDHNWTFLKSSVAPIYTLEPQEDATFVALVADDNPDVKVYQKVTWNSDDKGKKSYSIDSTTYYKDEACETPLTVLHNEYGIVKDGSITSRITPAESADTVDIPTVSVVSKPIGGDQVTLTANVTGGKDGDKLSDVTVVFLITHTATGDQTTVSGVLKDGKATATWIPNAPGEYRIVAQYSGDDTWLPSVSAPQRYMALDQTAGGTVDAPTGTAKDVYVLDAKDAIYGDQVTGTVKSVGEGGKESSVEGATIKAYTKDGKEVTNWNNGNLLLPGDYTLRASNDDGVLATRILHVDKRGVSVVAPVIGTPISVNQNINLDSYQKNLKVYETATMNQDEPEEYALIGSYGNQAAGYPGLFKLEAPGLNTTTPSAGSYKINAIYGNATTQNDFLSKYTPVFKSGQLDVVADTYTVDFGCGANGKIGANVEKGSISNGAAVNAGAWVAFTALPDEGFTVSKWTVSSVAPDGTKTPIPIEGNQNISLSNDGTMLTVKNLSTNIDVQVAFSNTTYPVTFSKTGDGTLTATNNGQSLTSDTNVSGGSAVTFTATPGVDQVVQKWEVKKGDGDYVVQKNDDGSAYTGTTLSIDSVDEALDVKVTFAQAEAFTVEGEVVDENGDTLTGADMAIDGLREGLSDGKNALSGDKITFTVTPGQGQMVQRWEVQTDGGQFEQVSGSSNQYILENVQADTKVRAVVNTVGATKHTLTYEVAGAAEAGNLTATVGDETVQSGAELNVGTPVDFTFTPKDGYEVVKWTVNDEDVKDSANKTSYQLDRLEADTTVTVTVQKMSQVTITAPNNGTAAVMVGDKAVKSGDFVPTGSTITVTMTPNTGYVADDLEGFTTEKAPANSDVRKATLEVTEAGKNIAIAPSFSALPQHGVTFAVTDTNGDEPGGTNGFLTASVERKGMAAYKVDNYAGTKGSTVYEGSDVTFTATPDQGYRVKEWRIDDKMQDTKEHTLKVENVTKATEVTVQFEALGNKIYATSGAHGQITEAKAGSSDVTEQIKNGVTLSDGVSLTLTATPDTGYEVASWTVNGKVQEGETANTFTYEASDGQSGGDIKVTFQPIAYNVAWQGDGGSVTAKVDSVAQSGSEAAIRGGKTVTFKVTPDPGMVVSHWTLNGKTVEGETGKTFEWTVPVGKDANTTYTIGAVCKENDEKVTLTYAASPEKGGTVTVDGGKDGSVTVTKGSNVTFTAEPNDTYYIKGWKVGTETVKDSANKKTFTFENATEGKQVTALFAKEVRYDVGYEVEGDNGALSATVDGEPLTLGAGQTEAVDGGSSLAFTATPDEGYMLKEWQISTDNGKNWTTVTRDNIKALELTMNHPLAQTLTVDSLDSNFLVKASFEQLVEFELPQSDGGVIISDITLLPEDSASKGHVRKGGDVSFTVKPDSGKDFTTISKLLINGEDFVNGGEHDNITVTKNADGSYKVVITDVNAAITTEIEAQKVVLGDMTVPDDLKDNEELDSVQKIEDAFKTRLDTEHTGSQDGTVFYDIALKHWDAESDKWVDVSEENFPENGVNVTLPYPDGSDKNDTFTVLHMTASGEHAGSIEVVKNVSKQDDGLHFHVNHLSPFAVCWDEYTAPAPDPGPGPFPPIGDDSYDIVLGDTEHGTIQSDVDSAEADETVTLTVTPDEGYVLDNLLIYGNGGNVVDYKDLGDGTYTFIMPDSDVNIIVVFKEVQGSCDGGEDCPSHGFTDVDISKWYHEAVDYVIQHGMMVGVSDTTFGTDMATDRGMIVTILHRLEGEPAPESASAFEDVSDTAYYANAIAWAAENDIVSGYDATHFGPTDAITREQMASILYRYATYKGMDTSASADLSGFSDADQVSGWAKDTMAWANAEGLIVGADNKLDPQGKAVRCQSAAILMRFVEHTNE